MSTATRPGMSLATEGKVRLRAVTGALEVYADAPVELGRESGLLGAVGAIHDPARAMVEVEVTRAGDLAALIVEAALRSAGGLDPIPPIDPSAPQPTNRTEALAIAWTSIRRARAAARTVTSEGDRAVVLAMLANAVTGYAGAQPHPTLEARIGALEAFVARIAAGTPNTPTVRAEAEALLIPSAKTT